MSAPRPLVSAYVVISLALTLVLDGVSALATEVVMRTSMGDIRILLYDDDSPITVANFLQYVDEGFFDGDDGLGQTIFHRVIPGFVIQAGGHLADLTEKVTHDPIVIESDNGLSNLRGTIAMARTSDPDSATSQFFINHVNNPGLDYASEMNPGYAVFGRVIDGMDVVDAIAAVETETQGEYQDVPVVPIPVTDAERVAMYVDDDNCPGPGSGTQSDPFCTIQDCIDATFDGQECHVRPGTYNETINFNGKAITVQSTDGADVTTIDGAGLNDSVVKCVSGEGADTVLQGLTITGGSGGMGLSPSFPSDRVGGGMSNIASSPAITECIFRLNTAHRGGGMFNEQSDAMITNSVFEQNATQAGGSGQNGGGIANNASSPQVSGCTFIENFGSGGGGMGNGYGSQTVVVNSAFIDNTALAGGGILNNQDSTPWIINCLFVSNTADNRGGGVGNNDQSISTIVNCTFVDNVAPEGGGIINRDPTSGSIVTNSVVWGNSSQIVGSNAIVTYCDVQGGYPGTGNIDADPLFEDVGADDYSLLTGSGCIDAGNNEAVPPDVADLDDDGNTVERTPIDLDGLARFADDPLVTDTGNGTPPIVDMGAYEFGCGNGSCGSFENQCNCPEDCGTPPANEIAHGTCGDGIDNDCDGLIDCDDDGEDDCRYDTDCFGCAPVLPIEDPPHNARKNRYISFNPNNSDNECALQIRLASMRRCSGELSRACTVDDDCEAAVPGSGTCVEHPDVGTAGPWWVQAPQQEQLGCLPGPCGDEDWFARVDASVHLQTWALSTLHVGDCEMIPVATYEVRACRPPDGTECNPPLTIGTIAQPFVSPGFRGNYGDVVGPVAEDPPGYFYFTPPDGFTNINDVTAYILTKQNYGTVNTPRTHPTWVDLHGLGDGNPPQPPPPNGNPPNYILNVSDLAQIKKALVGDAWTGDPGNMNPQECP